MAYTVSCDTTYGHVGENPTKQGSKRPWVRFEREHSGVSVPMDRYHNDREQWCVTVEDDTSRRVFDITETDASSVSQAVEPLDSVDEEFDSLVPILEVITDYGSEFVNPRRDDWPDRDREFERYLHENDIDPHALRSRATAVEREDRVVLPDLRETPPAVRNSG